MSALADDEPDAAGAGPSRSTGARIAADPGPRPPGTEHAQWVARARRLAPLIDGVEYYRHLRRALLAARRQVLIVGWDFHSEIDLLRGDEAERAQRLDGWPVRMADLLEALVERRPELTIHLLIWEGASLFAFERQHLPRMKRPWRSHPRIRLEWARDTPRLSSHHWKVVTVDDRVAFSGGIDLTKCRWDDHGHRADEPRRRAPGLVPNYGRPYHDLQLAVDGPLAAVLADACRERWAEVTGEELAPPEPDDDAADPWPEELDPLLEDRDVAVALTQPHFAGREERRQVEASYVAQIEAAERSIYIETQYLAHEGVVAALEARLGDPDGPEVLLILPYGCPGQLQSMALDPRRDELLDRLRAADPGGRFGVYWPTLAGGAEEDVHGHAVYVHAKAMVVDDRLLRIGSSNLNNRSMGLDSELDLFTAVDADDADAVAAIASFRRRSLAYLLDVAPEAVAAAERERGSLVAAVEALREGRQTLQPFEHRADGVLHSIDLPLELADPLRPLDDAQADQLSDLMRLDENLGRRARAGANVAIGFLRRWRTTLLVAAGLLALVALWRWTPLAEWVEPATVRARVDALSGSALGLLGILAAFVVLATGGFPVTVLIAALGATLAPLPAVALSLCGSVASAALGFAVGRWFPARTLEPLFEGRAARLTGKLPGRDVTAVVIVRNLPVAPFALVNLVWGLTSIPLRAYLLGTALGMLPGIVVLAVLGGELGAWLEAPSWSGALGMGVAALAAVAVAFGARRLVGRLRRRRVGGAGDGGDGGA